MIQRALLGFAILFGAWGSSASSAVVNPFKVGAWQAGAYINDDTRAFVHCSAFVPYRSGILFYVAVDRQYNWRLGFSNNAWRLREGETIPVALTFDGEGPVRVTAVARGQSFVTIEMPSNSALIRAFRAAHQMDAFASGERYSFRLDGTARLLPALARCVRDQLNPAVAAAPHTAAPKPQPQVAPRVNPDTQRERAKLLDEAATEHGRCMTQQMRTLVPYSSEGAEVLAQVVITNCAAAEEKFVSLGVALLNLPRADIQRIVSDHLATRKKSMVAEIVTFRAELARAIANQPKQENPGEAKTSNGI